MLDFPHNTYKVLEISEMQGKIKISKRLLFTEGELINYLKTVKKFTKIEEEILAALTYKKAYEKINQKTVLIAFPYRESKEINLRNHPMVLAKDIGKFISDFAEQNSP